MDSDGGVLAGSDEGVQVVGVHHGQYIAVMQGHLLPHPAPPTYRSQQAEEEDGRQTDRQAGNRLRGVISVLGVHHGCHAGGPPPPPGAPNVPSHS